MTTMTVYASQLRVSLPNWKPSSPIQHRSFKRFSKTKIKSALKENNTTEKIKNPPLSSSAEEITKKYGLEAGLWKIFTSKEEEEEGKQKKSKGTEAKDLLAKYGGAYLVTSITLSAISFSLCYVLISAGIDVQDLLSRLGISAGEAGEKVGTFALAYAAHKAASPIRFPPTVALTPVVASWIGKLVDTKTKLDPDENQN